MASQSLKTILAALAAQLDNDCTSLKLVSYKEVDIGKLPESDFPCAFIKSGPAEIRHYITSTNLVVELVAVRIIQKAKDGEDALYDIWEDIADSLASDPQLNNTCICAEVKRKEPPVTWETANYMYFDCHVEITYEREF